MRSLPHTRGRFGAVKRLFRCKKCSVASTEPAVARARSSQVLWTPLFLTVISTAAIAWLLLSGGNRTAGPLKGWARAIDGDTLMVGAYLKSISGCLARPGAQTALSTWPLSATPQVGRERVRLYGIDAPEMRQRCKDAAGRAYDCGAIVDGISPVLWIDSFITCMPTCVDTAFIMWQATGPMPHLRAWCDGPPSHAGCREDETSMVGRLPCAAFPTCSSCPADPSICQPAWSAAGML